MSGFVAARREDRRSMPPEGYRALDKVSFGMKDIVTVFGKGDSGFHQATSWLAKQGLDCYPFSGHKLGYGFRLVAVRVNGRVRPAYMEEVPPAAEVVTLAEFAAQIEPAAPPKTESSQNGNGAQVRSPGHSRVFRNGPPKAKSEPKRRSGKPAVKRRRNRPR